MPIAAVLFDLDGTLADTLEDIAAAANHALAALGRPPRPVHDYRYLAGQGLRWLIERALATDDDDLVPEGMRLFREHYAVHSLDHTRPYPGIEPLLDELTRRRLKLAVLSNKPDPETRRLVAQVFGRWRFDAVAGHRPPAPLKPDPAAALAIADELGVLPGDWLYLGDTRVDMLTANAAGMLAVGVLWGFREEEELRQSGARAIIKEPAELIALMEEAGRR